MADPSEIRDPPPQPLLSLRRVLILAIILGAAGILVWTFSAGGDAESGTGCSNPSVVEFTPCPGSRILRQSTVGVELKQGFDGRITINGVRIPEPQMEGAVLPGSEAFEQLTPEQREQGPRPNNRNVVKFQPGEGKVIERFAGEVDVTVEYWQLDEGRRTSQTLDYTVRVT